MVNENLGGIRIVEFQTKAWILIYPNILNYIKMINYIKLYYYIISILSSGNAFATILQERYLDIFSGQIMDILAYKADWRIREVLLTHRHGFFFFF